MARKKANYDLAAAQAKSVTAPVLAYQPAKVRNLKRPIGLIGCGGITETHCKAYKKAGYNVVALCDPTLERAEKRRLEFFPDAVTYTDFHELLKRDDIEVVDIATHPQAREHLIPAALKARKHVLSQKPFVLDLDKGERFAELADKMNVKLAINQNGRWAPYFSYMRQAVSKKLIGDVFSVSLACHWNHQWITNTPFNNVHHVILYDFAIHWFDMLHCLTMGQRATRVSASLARAPHQTAKPPLLGQAMVEFENAQASLLFDGCTDFDPGESVRVMGTKGTLTGQGEVCGIRQVTLTTRKGKAITPELQGHWFPDGMHGAMAELLASIEQKRTPSNNPTDNLKSLAICFAAVVSAETGKPQTVGKVRRVPVQRCSVAAAK